MLLLAAALAICAPGPRDNCVVDGDTFWLAGEKVRIANIDTPEIHGQCDRERDLARQARERLAALMDGTIALHRQGRDRYGRVLARVTAQGRDVGAVLIAEGLAREWKGRRLPWC